ncbi:uncharacterized protein TM35_000131410 [Trypanosoma theileri]|uniref:Transmembrane protein n=1 Tax=Trypanosoma theileri TaxID=67003 RepID=A0A1X0NWQ4_9TRYP|nr:uncharacterized protein TM35_000131410 [Trypanosoma theileri]ORC89137.1 hypothetical protein TM35_000131410 [Trypanosoma theileri]
MRRIRITGFSARNHTAVTPSSSSSSSSSSLLLTFSSPWMFLSLREIGTVSEAKPSKKRSSFFQMGDIYKPGKFTSKDLPKGPTASNQPWDPVFAHYAFNKATGPLQRKQNTTPDDHLTVDELDKWMDAKAAAKVLGIKESELSTLTAPQVEERWIKMYGERTNAMQQEVVIAAEVLLEYIDSSLHKKKSRQYYRQYIDNARQAIDHETDLRRRDHRQKFIYLSAIAITVGCTIVLFVAFFRNIITRKDVENIGANAVSYLYMAFTQPTNPEPAPDYTLRYRETPTAMTRDQQSGLYGVTDTTQVRIATEVEEYRRQEEVELLRMLNDENERAAKEAKEQRVRESRVRVYRTDDFDASGELKENKTNGDGEVDPAAAFSQMSFRQFAAMMASQFGGGSRFQRITQDSVRRAEEVEQMQKRMGGRSSE